jgi:hypothetical protein
MEPMVRDGVSFCFPFDRFTAGMTERTERHTRTMKIVFSLFFFFLSRLHIKKKWQQLSDKNASRTREHDMT